MTIDTPLAVREFTAVLQTRLAEVVALGGRAEVLLTRDGFWTTLPGGDQCVGLVIQPPRADDPVSVPAPVTPAWPGR